MLDRLAVYLAFFGMAMVSTLNVQYVAPLAYSGESLEGERKRRCWHGWERLRGSLCIKLVDVSLDHAGVKTGGE